MFWLCGHGLCALLQVEVKSRRGKAMGKILVQMDHDICWSKLTATAARTAVGAVVQVSHTHSLASLTRLCVCVCQWT